MHSSSSSPPSILILLLPLLRPSSCTFSPLPPPPRRGLEDGGDGSASTCTFGFLLERVVQKDAATPGELEALMDHFHEKLASQPITEPEVIAGRG